jgi:hypothetical protein
MVLGGIPPGRVGRRRIILEQGPRFGGGLVAPGLRFGDRSSRRPGGPQPVGCPVYGFPR